jgi:transcriptional regulator with XRE-family HTH domain
MPDYGPRLRAARGWADISQDELAARLGREKQFVLRRELPPSHDRHQVPSKGDRLAIAAVCGVPPEFLEDGFGGRASSEVSERLAALEEQVRSLLRELLVREREVSPQTGEDGQQGEDPQPGRRR